MNKRRMEMEDVSWIAGPVFEILGWIQCPSPADVEAEGVLRLSIDRIMDLHSLSTCKIKVRVSALAVKIWNCVAFKATKQQNSCAAWSHTNTLVPVGLPCPAEVKSQSLSVLSSEPDAKSLASGENDTEYTESLCPSNFSISSPVFKSHNLHSPPHAHTHTQTHTNMSVRTHRHV